MKRLLRWLGIGLSGVAALVIIAYAVVYILSERILRHTYEVPAAALSIPTDPVSIIEGARLAKIRGCFGGCHGKEAEGVVMFDEPMIGRVVAPILLLPSVSTATLNLAASSGTAYGRMVAAWW